MGEVMAEPVRDNRPEEMTEAELTEYFYVNREDRAGEEVASRAPERLDDHHLATK